MLVLEKGQICPHAHRCKHNFSSSCWGARPNRDNEFVCSFYENGKILDKKLFNPLDKTGKMRVLLEKDNGRNR